VLDGSMELFGAKAVILATGGNGQVFRPTTNALICTGDGISMAYRAGAKLADMEMIQYHPTTLAGRGFLITEGARGEGAQLLNASGERFMEKYAPNKMELASRDVVCRAEQTEIDEGRGFPDGTVALDITVVPRKRIHEALREIVLVGRDFAGVDITREPIHIKPGNHYTMGGVRTDLWGQTAIPGLYAAGEVACVSVHGGNRLGANSLLDTLVFGRRSGEHAARRAQEIGQARPSIAALHDEERQIEALLSRERGSGRRVSEVRAELGETMDKHVAVFRDAEGIQAALDTVKRLQDEARSAYVDDRGAVFNQDVLGALELGFMLDCAECICVGALHRTESRGAQYRTDFPERNDDEWLKHIELSRDGDEPQISYTDVTITDWQPEERTY
jgi:succinate dehydrogenase / fumarate reductase flavoprotein subunit